MSNTPVIEENNTTDTLLALTVKQFAVRMQVSMPTAYAMTNQPDFPRLRAGKKILIPVAALERWIDDQVSNEATGRK